MKISSLNFVHYCKLIEDEVELDYPRLGISEIKHKKMYETEPKIKYLVYNNSLSCFNSVNNFEFDNCDITGNVLTVKAKD